MRANKISRLLAACASLSLCPAMAGIVLDDYSTNNSASYAAWNWYGGNATFGVSGGKLVPSPQNTSTGAGFFWNGGEKLFPGESVSIQAQPANSADGNGNAVGLSLSTTTSTSDAYRIMGTYNAGWKSVMEGGGLTSEANLITDAMPTWQTPYTLTLARGTGSNQNLITWTFSGGLTGTGSFTASGLTAATGLYFGTAAWRNSSGTPAWDNLTYNAATYYWDTDGTTAGFGSAPGTWGTDADWSADAAGTDATVDYTTTTSQALYFGTDSAGYANGGSATITVSGNQNAGSLTFGSQSGEITLTGGTVINLAAASTITVNNAADTIATALTGAGTSLTKAGSGILTLSGASTYAGGTAVSYGKLLVNGSITSAASVSSGATLGGTGTINGNVTYASGALASFTVGSPLTITGSLTLNDNPVHLNLPSNLGIGTYPLATYATSGSSGSFAATAPVVDSGSLAANTAASITVSGGSVVLHVEALIEAPVKLAITDVNGGLSPSAGVTYSVTVQSQDNAGTPRNVSTNTGVTLSMASGTAGSLGGTLTGTILAGQNSVILGAVTSSVAETFTLQAVTSSGPSLTAATTGVTVVAGNPVGFVISSVAAMKVGVPSQVSVTVEDAHGNTVPTYTGTVSLSSSDSLAVFSPNPYSFTLADAGVKTFAVSMQSSGTQSITAAEGPLTGTRSGILVDYDNTGSGGTITYTDASGLNPGSSPIVGGYVVHTFTADGTLVLPAPVSGADVLVVGGGGGGGGRWGSGGGAGGLIYNSGVSMAMGRTSVIIGNGGSGGTGLLAPSFTGNAGANGGNSVLGALTALGGGGGGGGFGAGSQSGQSGGSGGGGYITGAGTATQPGSASGGFGNNGFFNGLMFGGGGGAGAAATDTAGGIGLAYGISGISTYYAGGGGGINAAGTGAGAGGQGGGGQGGAGDFSPGGDGTANSGGGGGGGFNASAGSGGSGIVIVRYPYASTIPLGIALTSPADNQVVFSDTAVSATATVAGGTSPYAVTFHYKLTTDASYTNTTPVASAPYSVDLGTLAVGTYQIYATVTDGTTATGTSATTTFTVYERPSIFTWTSSSSGNWSTAANWTNDSASGTAPDSAGQSNYVLNFNQDGSYTPTNDLGSGFLLNRLNFGATSGTVTLAGGRLNLSDNSGTPPEINQNDAASISVGNDLALDANATFGGAGNGAVTLAGVISGSGSSLTMAGAGTLTLKGVNTYSGGTFVESGTLVLDNTGHGNPSPVLPPQSDLTISNATVSLTGDTYNCIYNTVGGTITIDSGGILSADGTINNSHNVSNLFLNGGVLAAGTGTPGGEAGNFTFSGGISVTEDSTISAAITCNVLTSALPFDVADGKTLLVSGVVANHPGSTNALTKTGPGTLELSGINTYTGDTAVLEGTLAVNGGSLADTGNLVIDGGKVDVAAAANEVVGTLYFGATQQAAGTYGSTASSAIHKDDTRFSGTGIVTVGPAGGYSTWALDYAGGGTPDQDYNNDGVANGVAYFMGMNGLATNPGIVNGTVTWPYLNEVASYQVQVSDNLVDWAPAAPGDVAETLPPGGQVIYTLPTGPGITKKFSRLMVVP